MQIGERGFQSLSARDSGGKIASRLAKESFSSPHLMQEFCRSGCKGNGVIGEDIKPVRSRLAVGDWDTFFRTHGSTTSKVVFDLLAQGPQQRSDRKERKLATGERTDIYGLLFRAISETGPLPEFEYNHLRRAMKDILAEEPPQRHEITRVLEEMTKIAKSHTGAKPVLEYESDSSTLYISDPIFAYYVRWGQRRTR